MKSISNIYLAWRKGKGFRRHVVGILRRNATDGIRFEYLSENVSNALKDGFVPYVDFPDLTKTYTQNVIDIFGQRIVQSERGDIQKYYDFWELNKNYIEDKFYMLAYTQGMLSTDNFEFLAEFFPRLDLCFVSEICGLTHQNHPSNTVEIGDELSWIKESTNPYDKFAVKVYKESTIIGYIKVVHNRVFYKNLKGKLRIVVKGIDQNGSINRIFVRISF